MCVVGVCGCGVAHVCTVAYACDSECRLQRRTASIVLLLSSLLFRKGLSLKLKIDISLRLVVQ